MPESNIKETKAASTPETKAAAAPAEAKTEAAAVKTEAAKPAPEAKPAPAKKPAAKKPAAPKVQYKTGLLVSSSPHLVTKMDTSRTMLYVLIGLVPCAVAATIFFGPGALSRILFGAVFAFLAEYCYDKIMKKPDTTGDLSCLVTGTILAMNVPGDFPIWMLCVGCCVAIIIVKCLYGGIGRNIANPAIVGRIVLLLSWTSYMTDWPQTTFQKNAVDAVSSATPLGLLSDGSLAGSSVTLGQMFLGNTGGALGETCTLAILIGGAFLIWKKIISPIIPCAFIGTVFLFALLYYGFAGSPDGWNAFSMAIFHVLAGGCCFGAFFCATDYVTSPIMKRGRLIYGIGCGAMTMIIRLFCSYPEGVSFAILFMNIMTPLIDRGVERSFYGIAKREKQAKAQAKAEAEAAGKKEGAKA